MSSKIEVRNTTETIKFVFDPLNSNWQVAINGIFIERLRIYGSYARATYFTLDEAVVDMKGKGLIPKEFDVEELKRVRLIEIKG